MDAALDGDDGFGLDFGPLAAVPPAAVKDGDAFPQRPGNHMLGVVGNGLFYLDPGLGQPGHVYGQYERIHGLALLDLEVL